jgi:hypothetical protein
LSNVLVSKVAVSHMADADSDDEWLQLLCRHRRPVVVENDDPTSWLLELISAHRSTSSTSVEAGGRCVPSSFDDAQALVVKALEVVASNRLGCAGDVAAAACYGAAGGSVEAGVKALEVVASSRLGCAGDVAAACYGAAGGSVEAGVRCVPPSCDDAQALVVKALSVTSPPALSSISRKRRRSNPLQPVTLLVAESLCHQHCQVMAVLGSDPRIHCSLMRSWITATSSNLAPASVEGLADSLAERVRGIVSAAEGLLPCIFKIGLTRDPLWRWRDAPFAYATSREFAFMEVLLVGSVSLVVHLEAALITRLGSVPGCYNTAPGGESPPPPSFPCYLYVVWQRVDDYIIRRLQDARKIVAACRRRVRGAAGGPPELSVGLPGASGGLPKAPGT